ncbi:MAG: hypothetical protein LRY73_16030 [Bacillus sp. (in: Bacteria)]|nr:hypothetical protein [Bacillus sp. (in: firmicutes)]
MKRWIKLSIFAMIFTFFVTTYESQQVLACECDVPETAEEAMEQADAVFRGTVIDMKTTKVNVEKYDVALLEVSETWKGIADTQVIVTTDWTSCGFSFEVGREYLLYPFYSGGTLFVINCGRSGSVEFTGEDLQQLGKGEVPSNEVNLEGQFHNNTNWTIPVVILLSVATAGLWFFQRRKKG